MQPCCSPRTHACMHACNGEQVRGQRATEPCHATMLLPAHACMHACNGEQVRGQRALTLASPLELLKSPPRGPDEAPPSFTVAPSRIDVDSLRFNRIFPGRFLPAFSKLCGEAKAGWRQRARAVAMLFKPFDVRKGGIIRKTECSSPREPLPNLIAKVADAIVHAAAQLRWLRHL